MKDNLKKLLQVRNLANGEAALYFYGEIVSSWWETWDNTDKYPEAIRRFLDGLSGPLNIYINSPGGSVTAGMAIYDTMQYIKCDVSTICIGMAASMGAFLLSSGAKGKRIALPNAEIMIHQPLGGTQGQTTDMQIHVERMLKIKQHLNEILARNTGKPIETIRQDTERDNFMTAEQAKEYGLVDKVIYTR